METLGEEWRTGKLGRLQSMGSQRVGHDLATEQEQSMGTETMGRILCETVVSDHDSLHTEQITGAIQLMWGASLVAHLVKNLPSM